MRTVGTDARADQRHMVFLGPYQHCRVYIMCISSNASQVALLSVTSTKPNNPPPNHYTNPGLRLKYMYHRQLGHLCYFRNLCCSFCVISYVISIF